jgi:hypothetical protein
VADFNFSTLFTANDEKFKTSVSGMRKSLNGLNKTFTSGASDTKKYFRELQKNNNMFNKMSKDANRASNGINNLGKSFKGLNQLKFFFNNHTSY